MRVDWLPDVLRADGLTVIEHRAWRGFGPPLDAVRGVVEHDTVTPATMSDHAVADLLRNGHSTLRGPLSQLGLDRRGRFWMIADGRCNHNGFGEWGNNSIGIEVFCYGGKAGREEPWNDRQFDSAARGTAAILRHLGRDERRAKGHKETDPRRKIDPYGVDMAAFRAAVAARLQEEDWIVTPEDEAKVRTIIREELHRALMTNEGSVKIGDRQFPIANDVAGAAINAAAAARK